MSTRGTIPILSPDGQVHSIPQDQLGPALEAGGMPVATVKDPQGQTRWIPSDQVEAAQQAGGKVVSRAPHQEELQYLVKKPGHTWLTRNPTQFPNREEGIYPSGPGNEWRNDPNSPMATMQQAPIDLHLALHTYQGLKMGVIGATLPLAFEATLPQLVGGLVGGTAGGYAGQKIAEAAGAGPVGQEVAGGVGGLVGGLYGANRAAGFVRGFRAGLTPPPTAEVLQARGLAQGATTPPPEPASALGQIRTAIPPEARLPAAFQPAPPSYQPPVGTVTNPFEGSAGNTPVGATPGAAGSMMQLGETPTVAPQTPSATPSGAGLPRTLSGESALGQVLSRLDNQSLLKIARSRGINVSQEALLKPGTANGRLIQKIANDFSPDELEEFRDRYLESSRFAHQFPATMSPEAWSTIATQTYFPDVAIPKTVAARTRTAMATTNSPAQGVTPSRRR